MGNLSRRSVLRTSLAAAAAETLARPYIANAAATTAEVWWVQGPKRSAFLSDCYYTHFSNAGIAAAADFPVYKRV